MQFKFGLEKFEHVFHEMYPLLKIHYREVAHYQDIPLEINVNMYQHVQDNGSMRIYTARDLETNELIGYSVYFIRHNLHYESSLQAVQDVIFIDPRRRGFGMKFIDQCDRELKAMGVQAVYHHVKTAHNWGKILERLDYEAVDIVYARRLDKMKDKES